MVSMKIGLLIGLFLLIFLIGCSTEIETEKVKKMVNLTGEKATFAGGCFWCMEAAFEGIEGVGKVVSGYAGEKGNPTYAEVAAGKTKYKEAIQVFFDPKKISYEKLVDIFWKQIDPTDAGGQFVDRGPQYTTAIYYHNETQKKVALKSKQDLEKSGKFAKPIVTEILPFSYFYLAEEYHQDYSKKRTAAYKIYEVGSGRPQYKKKIWEK